MAVHFQLVTTRLFGTPLTREAQVSSLIDPHRYRQTSQESSGPAHDRIHVCD